MQTLEGHAIEHYRILRHLARGGMSDIYLAKDTHTNHSVAIKMVQSSNQEYCERFRYEVEATAALKHDHILPAIAHGKHESSWYMISPYIKDGTLQDRLTDGPLSFRETGQILKQLVSALQFAHDHGIIHRDLKPSNILLHDKHHVYLTDFGLAQHIHQSNGFTISSNLMGTPEYMAPELSEGAATIRSDIYALGIILYQLLTGRVPFKGSTPMGTYLKHIRERPVAPTALNPAIPEEIEVVILRALEKNPAHRFGSACELAAAYHRALRQSEKQANKRAVPLHNMTLSSTAQIVLAPKKNIHWPRLILAAVFCIVVTPGTLGFLYYNANYHTSRPVLPVQIQGSGVNIPNIQLSKTPTIEIVPILRTVVPGKAQSTTIQVINTNDTDDDPPDDINTHGSEDGHGHHRAKFKSNGVFQATPDETLAV
jgi:serine/threonine protein kinase